MTQAVRDYLLAVVAASLISSILLALVPKGPVHRTLTFLCGLALVLVTIGPVAKIDFDRMAASLARAEIAAEEAATGVTFENQDLMAAIIKEKAETYILDKANGLGFSPTVSMKVDTGGEYPYPYSVVITGSWNAAQREQLSIDLEQNLAVPAERQEWKTDEKTGME